MYYNGEIVEGIIRVPFATIFNGETLTRPLLISGKFILYGYFVEYETVAGSNVKKLEIVPVNGLVLFRFIEYMGILSCFLYPEDNKQYAYFSLVPLKTVREVIKLFDFYDIFKQDFTKEIYEYEIELP